MKEDLFAAADVFALPSFSESLGLAAVEALSAGLPCVLGRGVALAEQASRVGAGVVVDPDPESIAEGLRRYLVDPGARRVAGAAAVTLFRQDFSLERMGERLVSLYRSILDARSRRPS
jgi:glycosyltransferase involved in cell wall biosynthesis